MIMAACVHSVHILLIDGLAARRCSSGFCGGAAWRFIWVTCPLLLMRKAVALSARDIITCQRLLVSFPHHCQVGQGGFVAQVGQMRRGVQIGEHFAQLKAGQDSHAAALIGSDSCGDVLLSDGTDVRVVQVKLSQLVVVQQHVGDHPGNCIGDVIATQSKNFYCGVAVD